MEGEGNLKTIYNDKFSDKDYQPAGIDLRLGELFELDDNFKDIGVINDTKMLPKLKRVNLIPQRTINGAQYSNIYEIEPNKVYFATVDKEIKIPENMVQFYYPRSSFMRCGVNVYSAVGDPGFKGTLQFMIINHGYYSFFTKPGERFAQLVMEKAHNVQQGYNGTYQEE